MSLQNTEELIEKLDSQEIGISIPDSQKDPPSFSCDCDNHQGEDIREGEKVIVLCCKYKSQWTIENCFCSKCSVVDEFSKLPDSSQKAVVEGVICPDPKSNEAYLRNSFIWEINNSY